MAEYRDITCNWLHATSSIPLFAAVLPCCLCSHCKQQCGSVVCQVRNKSVLLWYKFWAGTDEPDPPCNRVPVPLLVLRAGTQAAMANATHCSLVQTCSRTIPSKSVMNNRLPNYSVIGNQIKFALKKKKAEIFLD